MAWPVHVFNYNPPQRINPCAVPRFMHDKEERKQVVVYDIKTEQLGVDDGHFSLHVADGKQLWQVRRLKRIELQHSYLCPIQEEDWMELEICTTMLVYFELAKLTKMH
jgi:hypothetical protein